MKRYIFTQRNGIHIIDLQQTLGLINEAYRAMVQVAADGGKILFVGTKRQAQEVVQSEAERCGMWYVNQRWLGGTLTNFQTIRGRINHMIDLQQKRDAGYFRVLPKKEGVKLRDTLARLEKYFLGMREMNELPKALFVIDIGKEDICIAEARRMGIQIFAIVDTDCDPLYPGQRRRRSVHSFDRRQNGHRRSGRGSPARSHDVGRTRRAGTTGASPARSLGPDRR